MLFLASPFRAVFVAVCIKFAILFGLCSPAAADFEAAKSHFQLLPEERRATIPLMLIATGYYNGMSTGEFNTRIYQGITRFQRDNGFAATGALNEAAGKLLNLRGAQLLDTWGMEETIHPAASAKLFVPLKLLEPATRHGSQVNYEAADGSLSVNLSRVDSSDQDLTQLHALLSTSNSERQVGYNVIRANFFAVAGSYRGRDYYSRYHPVDGGSVGFTLAWDKARVPYGDRIAVLMSNLFFTGLTPSVAAQPTPDAPNTPSPSGADTVNDLALLKATAKTKAATFRKEPVGLGDRVYVLGSPIRIFFRAASISPTALSAPWRAFAMTRDICNSQRRCSRAIPADRYWMRTGMWSEW